MNKKLAAMLVSGVMAISSIGFVPAKVNAADEYLIRDKWGFCTTQNYAESEHFVIFYGNNDTTGYVNDSFLKKNLEYYEKYWHCYGEYLGMENMNVDIYGKSQQKYKTNVYLTYTGLPRTEFKEGWAFMSSEDGYGIEIISPEAMLDDMTTSHEFGHVITMQQKAWVDSGITGAWWEPLANWFREMYLDSDYNTGKKKTEFFEPYLRNLSLTLPHGRNYYQTWPFLSYISYNPDNIPGLGIDCVKRIISEAKMEEYPLDTLTRLFGIDAQTILGHYAKRMATLDIGPKELYRSELKSLLSNSPHFWNLIYTVPDYIDGRYISPEEEAPMQGGLNIIPLNITGESISVSLNGLSNDSNAGWQACIVTEDASGNASYSELFGDGGSASISTSGAVKAYITVVGAPKTFNRCNAFHKENDSPYKTGDERRRYPYEFTLEGAEVQQSGGFTKTAWGHAHSNGGGWVSMTARVADSVYVGPDAMVLGNAVLSGNVRVEDHAVVANSVTASDNVVISGHAIVNGGGWVYDNGWYEGSVKLSGNAQIGDSAVVYNSCTVSGNAKVLQKAYLSEGTTVKDNVVVKGMAAPTGRSTYSGTAILDGDYTNNENKQSGIGYGWLDDYGWVNAQEGLTSGYDFLNKSDVWASDNNASTSVLIKNAQWQAERTSASGVLSFDGDNDYALIDSSAVRSKNLQISFAVLPKGGKTQQEVFHFGDDKAYMSFTPKNNDGKAEFTITDGTDTQVLTSPSLPEGQWSKVTVLIMDGYAVLYVNSQPVDTQEARLDPVMVLSASENDTCYLGKGIIAEDFNGAVDYINFSYKTIGEPGTVYSGSEEAEKEPEQPTEPVTEPETEPVTEPVPQKIIGDVNADKQLSAADVVMLSKWLIKEGGLTDPDAADADYNDMINVIDLLIIKRSVISQL